MACVFVHLHGCVVHGCVSKYAHMHLYINLTTEVFCVDVKSITLIMSRRVTLKSSSLVPASPRFIEGLMDDGGTGKFVSSNFSGLFIYKTSRSSAGIFETILYTAEASRSSMIF